MRSCRKRAKRRRLRHSLQSGCIPSCAARLQISSATLQNGMLRDSKVLMAVSSGCLPSRELGLPCKSIYAVLRYRLRLGLQFFRDLEQLLPYYLGLFLITVEELKNEHLDFLQERRFQSASCGSGHLRSARTYGKSCPSICHRTRVF